MYVQTLHYSRLRHSSTYGWYLRVTKSGAPGGW